MNQDIVTFFQVLFGIVCAGGALAAITVGGILTLKRFGRSGTPSREAIPDDRLQRLEQAVDAIAIEVERISEAQRYSARLLAERSKEKTPG